MKKLQVGIFVILAIFHQAHAVAIDWKKILHFDSKQKEDSALLKKAEKEKTDKKRNEFRKDRGKNLTSPGKHWRQGKKA